MCNVFMCVYVQFPTGVYNFVDKINNFSTCLLQLKSNLVQENLTKLLYELQCRVSSLCSLLSTCYTLLL